MQKFLIAIFFVLQGCFVVSGQKNDYTWLMGYDSFGGEDTACQCWFAITKFDFNQTPFVITHDSLGINFQGTNSTISDSNGNLVLYSNGVTVRNANDEILLNGDSLGWGPALIINPDVYIFGMPYCQWSVILPNPLRSNLYDMFYVYLDTLPGSQYSFSKVLRSRIDMSANGGRGAVTEKDVPMLNKEIDITISAVRHGNGRDWWLCTNETSTNCHDIFLYTGMDSLAMTTQCTGTISPYGDLHACRFSTDGNFYVTTTDSGQVTIYNFDRCTGVLSLKEEFIIPEIAENYQWAPTGLEFSSDSRFLYVFCSYRIFQYDLTNTPIALTKDTIAQYSYPGHHPSNYFWGQLAPDGKIYVSSGSSSYYLSVIDSPNAKGALCGFVDQNMHIPTFVQGLPYNPNYRLGALTQSQCDSLSNATQDIRDAKEKILNVFPNPTNEIINIDYGFTDWSKGVVNLEITNELGQRLYVQSLPMYSGYLQADISGFAGGIYTVILKRNGAVVATTKLVKQ